VLKIEQTTKITMAENDQINSELSYQSKQVDDILTENKKMKEESKTLRRKLAVLTQLEEELTKKNQSNQQIIKVLLGKLKSRNFLSFYLFTVIKVKEEEISKKIEEEAEIAILHTKNVAAQQGSTQVLIDDLNTVKITFSHFSHFFRKLSPLKTNLRYLKMSWKNPKLPNKK
jgi:regulator of replication initiation timing